jgi:hypothetical protein
MTKPEEDVRVKLLNTLLATPHRNVEQLYPIHQEILKQDPLFYVHLAAWYAAEGSIRDHKELFCANLILSRFQGHRDVGLALLREMPPYQVERTFNFIKGKIIHKRIKKDNTFEIIKEKRGLFYNVPRSMKTEIVRYLREREAKPEWFDATVLQARKALKRLYASQRIAPSKRAQAILFDDKPPKDSRLYALKAICQAATPAEQARAIVENRIPYRVAASIIKKMTPTVLAALINSMSPQELINNIASLKRHGAFENSDIKGLIDEKLEQAKTDNKVSAYKAKVAVEASSATGELAEKLDKITETQVKATGKITRATALLIDKSSSMNTAIEVGKQLGAMISSICQAELYAYAFDTVAYPIQAEGATLKDWENALAGILSSGATSCGVALEWMRRKNLRVEQIVMITDEGENTPPRFKDAYQAYETAMNIRPDVIFVKVGFTSRALEQDCKELGIATNAFEFRGDYYALPNVVPFLTRPSTMELVMEILNYPLPQRKII